MADTSRPAFPGENNADGFRGMSLRDWFAGQALTSLAPLLVNSGSPNMTYGPSGVTGLAYKLADAMLAERSRSDG